MTITTPAEAIEYCRSKPFDLNMTSIAALITSLVDEGWNFDISEAPIDRPIMTATQCDMIIKSHWLPDQERWLGYKAEKKGGKLPVAWRNYPAHPHTLDETPPVL